MIKKTFHLLRETIYQIFKFKLMQQINKLINSHFKSSVSRLMQYFLEAMHLDVN